MGTNAAPAFTSKPPDWVFMTRGGSRVCTVADLPDLKTTAKLSGTNMILGRYAFVMYEEGGLLDLNTAGYPSTALAETGGTNALSGKSYTAYADLTQIPGLTASMVDQIINWRSKGSLISNTNRFISTTVSSATNGFLKFQSGDSPLLGRQDLINYFKQTPSLANSLQALSFLGTFSRAVNAPSWSPVTPTSTNSAGQTVVSTINYAAQAETAGKANRNLANVRFSNNFNITHYRDDGSATSISVRTGDALLQQRFSLLRLAWLTHTGPATGMTNAVRSCLGLTWGVDGFGNPSWVYNHGDASRILTLDEVAAAGREPDFFELLKAAILSGSLGKHPGRKCLTEDYAWSPDFGDRMGVLGNLFEDYMNAPDIQILAIGANIIDQYDADSYPTAICLKWRADGLLLQGPVNSVYGQENLPSITRLVPLIYEQTRDFLGGWFQPELWNPNQMPPNPVTASWPTKFRITMYGQAYVGWNQYNSPNQPHVNSPPVNYDNGTQQQSHICFELATPAAFSDTPKLLTTSSVANSDGTPTINVWRASEFQTTDNGNPFLGIYVGPNTSSDPKNYDSVENIAGSKIQAWIAPANGPITFALEYYDGTRYLPYNFVSRLFARSSSQIEPSSTDVSAGRYSIANRTIHYLANSYSPGLNGPVCDRFYAHSDPRTDRFSVATSDLSHAGKVPGGSYEQRWYYNTSMVSSGYAGNNGFKSGPNLGYPRPDANASPTVPATGAASPVNGFFYDPRCVSSGWAGAGDISIELSDWVVNNPSSPGDSCWAYYADPDGITRPGDGYRVTYSTTGDGTMVFTNPIPAGSLNNNIQNGRRPVILNRPFRSVGELGYAYRDLPYKSLDFFSSVSADAALLDLFSVADEPALVAGQININTASTQVLQAILSGASKKEIDATLKLSGTDAQQIATAISAGVIANPLINRANLATSLSGTIYNAFTSSPGKGNKAYLEAPVRALASAANTRTWNLLIDVVAQTGRFSPKALTLDDFIVEGERRYWLHVAIDRYTGKIIDQQLEPVYE
ncbi:MAG: hypothetical protein WCH43_00535 [Verrucomicrobiota bacterium]